MVYTGYKKNGKVEKNSRLKKKREKEEFGKERNKEKFSTKIETLLLQIENRKCELLITTNRKKYLRNRASHRNGTIRLEW